MNGPHTWAHTHMHSLSPRCQSVSLLAVSSARGSHEEEDGDSWRLENIKGGWFRAVSVVYTWRRRNNRRRRTTATLLAVMEPVIFHVWEIGYAQSERFDIFTSGRVR